MNKSLGIILTMVFSMGTIPLTGQYYDALIIPEDEWIPPEKHFSINAEGAIIDTVNSPSKFLHGTNWKNDPHMNLDPLEFDINFPVEGKFIVSVDRVSIHSELEISFDGNLIETLSLTAGPGEGPWKSTDYLKEYDLYQSTYDNEYSFQVKAGSHRITLENKGADWISFNYFIFTDISSKPVSSEYEEWQLYKNTLVSLPDRLTRYKKIYVELTQSLQPGDLNFDVLPTLELQLTNFQELIYADTDFNFDLMRTDKEFSEIVEYIKNKKDYFQTKRGRIKRAYRADLDDSLQPYDIMLPDFYDPDKKYGLLVQLHGYEIYIQKYKNFLWADSDPALDDMQLIKTAVYGRRNQYYLGAGEQDVLLVINELVAEYSIDTNRIYLAGASMGGYGSWKIALNYPDLFAAVSPLCGPANMEAYGSSHFPDTDHQALLDAYSPIQYIQNARYLPADIQHGAVDQTVRVRHSREMVKYLSELDFEHRYTEYPNVGHSVWNNADADEKRLPYLLNFKRNPYPDLVNHTAFFLRHGKAYWIDITGKQIWNQFARISAQIFSSHQIRINTENISSFSLNTQLPQLSGTSMLSLNINNQEIQLSEPIPELLILEYKSDKWQAVESVKQGLIKRKFLEGPWLDAEKTGAYKLIVGTKDPAKTQFLISAGQRFKEFQGEYAIELQIMNETDVEYTSGVNMHLIGHPGTNSILSEIADQLPVKFNEKDFTLNHTYELSECGLRMIYPNPKIDGQYVLIDHFPDGVEDFNSIFETLVGDYMVYTVKSGELVILEEGFFNSNWELEKGKKN